MWSANSICVSLLAGRAFRNEVRLGWCCAEVLVSKWSDTVGGAPSAVGNWGSPLSADVHEKVPREEEEHLEVGDKSSKRN